MHKQLLMKMHNPKGHSRNVRERGSGSFDLKSFAVSLPELSTGLALKHKIFSPIPRRVDEERIFDKLSRWCVYIFYMSVSKLCSYRDPNENLLRTRGSKKGKGGLKINETNDERCNHNETRRKSRIGISDASVCGAAAFNPCGHYGHIVLAENKSNETCNCSW